VGVCKPRVVISETAKSVLSDSEMRVAIQHELKHKDSGDNLKRFLISSIPFPGMKTLDAAWQKAAELAADDAAVKNRREALDLASALIKLSRFVQLQAMPPLVTGFVAETAFTTLRVEYLLKWNEKINRNKYNRMLSLIVLISTIALIALNYETALALTHRLTELLVP
jgi:beta-lactamase regulating signal transducer with metallopeptidase domain